MLSFASTLELDDDLKERHEYAGRGIPTDEETSQDQRSSQSWRSAAQFVALS